MFKHNLVLMFEDYLKIYGSIFESIFESFLELIFDTIGHILMFRHCLIHIRINI